MHIPSKHGRLRAQATGAAPSLTVEQSTVKHLELIQRLTPADNGKYISAPKSEELPY